LHADALGEALNKGKSVKEFVASLSDYEKHGFNSVMQSAQDFIAMVEEEDDFEDEERLPSDER
jgi:hypothetical protein